MLYRERGRRERRERRGRERRERGGGRRKEGYLTSSLWITISWRCFHGYS